MREVIAIGFASVVGLSFGFTSGLILLRGEPGEYAETTQSEHAKLWLLARTQGRLRCEGAGAVILNLRGTDYAVNGMASNRYPPIQAVISDPNADFGPTISRGLTLCKW